MLGSLVGKYKRPGESSRVCRKQAITLRTGHGLTQKFDIQGIPIETARRATFLIDKSGKIINEQVDDAGRGSNENRGGLRAAETKELTEAANQSMPSRLTSASHTRPWLP